MKIEKVEVQEIARSYGTPVYVYSLETLRKAIQEIKQLSPVTRYAMKASSNVRILQEMLANGVKIDAVSVYEVQRALRAGYKAEDICFTSDVFFNADDINYCLENNIYCNCNDLICSSYWFYGWFFWNRWWLNNGSYSFLYIQLCWYRASNCYAFSFRYIFLNYNSNINYINSLIN